MFYVPKDEEQYLAVALKRCGAFRISDDWNVVGNMCSRVHQESLVIGVRTRAGVTDERAIALRRDFPAVFDRGENEARLGSGGLALLDTLEASSIRLLDEDVKAYAPELTLDAPDDVSRDQLTKILNAPTASSEASKSFVHRGATRTEAVRPTTFWIDDHRRSFSSTWDQCGQNVCQRGSEGSPITLAYRVGRVHVIATSIGVGRLLGVIADSERRRAGGGVISRTFRPRGVAFVARIRVDRVDALATLHRAVPVVRPGTLIASATECLGRVVRDPALITAIRNASRPGSASPLIQERGADHPSVWRAAVVALGLLGAPPDVLD